jgi:hypothetical protein
LSHAMAAANHKKKIGGGGGEMSVSVFNAAYF